ncbi:MAG TPA: hypothetical protein VKT81_25100 [Bryobacteraceae bacterium]|nr:hypothetical protein [Bryobacteraceae bacterium]
MRFRNATLILGIVLRGIAAQTADSSGDGNLFGDYFVREVMLAGGKAFSLSGTITFDGQGNYSFTGTKMDSSTGKSVALSAQLGTYSLNASGLVSFSDPIDHTQTDFGGTGLFGRIGGVSLLASATEGSVRNILIAIPAGSSMTNASLQGAYSVAFIDFLQGNVSLVRDGYFTLHSSGNGSLGNFTVTGALANAGSKNTTQSLTNVTYDIAGQDGSGTLSFPPVPSLFTLLAGQKDLFLSADGLIFIAGDPSGFDLMIGIRASSGNYQGTYVTAGLENNAAGGKNAVDAFSGSVFSLGNGTSIAHQRLATLQNPAIDDTFAGGTLSNGAIHGILGDSGQAFLQVGTGSFYTLIPGLGVSYIGPNPFLDPLKVWNAANLAPVTNPVAPGEFVSLFGSGLCTANEGALGLPLPTTLGKVQVTVNGTLAPISYVSPNQINVLVPYEVSGGYATFQVSSDVGLSNPVTLYLAKTAPGVFASTAGGFAPGLGPAAAQHADFSALTEESPAKVGETLMLYVTGLGAVSPSVKDGFAAPGSPLSYVVANVTVSVDGLNAPVSFAGLAPGFAGLYQVNFEVPKGVSSGRLVSLSVGTPDAVTDEAKLYIK